MSGLILLMALAALLYLFYWASGFLTKWMKSGAWKTLLRMIFVVAMFPLIVADEIVGKQQFEALCKANGINSIDVSSAAKKNVFVKYSDRIPVAGTAIPILESSVSYRLNENAPILFSYKNYYSRGGWIMRYTPLNMGGEHPMLFGGNGCGFSAVDRVFSKYKISVIN